MPHLAPLVLISSSPDVLMWFKTQWDFLSSITSTERQRVLVKDVTIFWGQPSYFSQIASILGSSLNVKREYTLHLTQVYY